MLITVMVYMQKLDVNAVDELGFAPIHYACKKGYRDIVKLLLKKDSYLVSVN